MQEAKSGVFDDKYQLTINRTTVGVLKFFYRAFELSFNKIHPYLKDGSKKYIFTGHSLGGALASLLAIKMFDMYQVSLRRSPL